MATIAAISTPMERNKSALFYLNKAQELRPSDEMKAMIDQAKKEWQP
ncbi:hypothetical protein KJ640_08395 [bacterium]|nr:hypothetical protein [bacterium]